jgi:alkylation response protein AidB-like acyl-CoA dehydrogenase
VDFTFTEEQRMMAASLRSLLDDLCAPAQLRAVFEGRDTGAAQRWRRLAELGLFGVLAGESCGGLGLGELDFVLLAQEAGRAALPEPLCEQAGIAVPLLAELADVPAAAALLPQAVRGESRIALLHPLQPYANVPPGVTHWLLCSQDAIHLFTQAEVTAEPRASVDAGRRLHHLASRRGDGQRLADGSRAREIVARAASRGALYAAAQCLGLSERMLEVAVAYARERIQFGRPVGSYQAIKHHLASVAVKLEFARPVVYAATVAAARADEEPHARAALSHAKLAAADSAELAARTAIQVHGAMGYSWEVDLHFYMKRAWALSGLWGDRSYHARRIESLLADGAFALGPEETFQYSAQGTA